MCGSEQQLRLIVVPADGLPRGEREAVVDLCTRAYGQDLRSLMGTFHGATHVLGYMHERLVAHALWVTRWLQVGDAEPLRTAYIEAVATDGDFRRRGFARAAMARVIDEIQDFGLGGLSPFSVGYYERLGWELWRGPLFIRAGHGMERSPDDEQVMIHRLPETPDLDLSGPLSAEWREGELW